ncbi:MAG: DUF4304 domain-containing protein [Saprospiraceae bacterium]
MHTQKIKTNIAPKLREQNWKGTGFHFRRVNDNQTIDLLMVQMNRDSRSFCIEIGVYFTFIESLFVTDLKKVKAYDTDIRKRLTPNDEDDYWWDIINNRLDKAFLLDTRTALFLAKIHFQLGNFTKVIEFSKFGLSTIVGNVGSALILDFERLIEKSRKRIATVE